MHGVAAPPLVPSQAYEVDPAGTLTKGKRSHQLRFAAIPGARQCSSTDGPPLSHEGHRPWHPRRPPTPWNSPQEEQEDEDFLDFLVHEDSDDGAQWHAQYWDGGLWGSPIYDGHSNWYDPYYLPVTSEGLMLRYQAGSVPR
jgi:hypothetical protein